jgi:hypothetical protein
VALLIAVGPLPALAKPALVSGAARVFLRRGPGLDFQAFATVERGQRLEVEEVSGSWVLVRTANEQRGYMHAVYLTYADGSPVAGSGAPTPAGVSATPAAPAPGADDLRQQNAELAAEVERLRRDLETARQAPVSAPGDDLVALRAEVRRLADITDALRSRLDGQGGGVGMTVTGEDEEWATSTVLMLCALTLFVGWGLGSVVSRREERNKRTRIRF